MIAETRKKINKLVLNDPVFSQDDKHFLDREEAFDRSMEKSVHYVRMAKKLKLDRLEAQLFKGVTTMMDADSFGLSDNVFLPTIQSQGTDEQREKWLPLIHNYEIIGSYAQTELGHGTNVRGLETTATYDPSTQEFILDTPTLTATKFWPGTLGHTATHAVVLAQLITRGVNYGIHPFIVQLRSLEDHTPLPGITVGDIGPKLGYFGMDNGFLKLDKVRIPRDQMLMRYSKVTPDGTYIKPPSDKITYGTMVMVRSGIVLFVAMALSRAVTIATRYSVVRRQGQVESGSPEVQVMDYQTQQMKLLPLIASSYALILTGQYILRVHMQSQSEIANGNLESLPELHATSAGLKAFSSMVCGEGIELCRQACGGHGYSRACGIPDIFVDFIPAVTYEGENTVMFLQTARYLSKLYLQRLPASKLPSNVSYLASDYYLHKSSPLRTAEQFLDSHVQLEAYRQRARRMVAMASEHYQDALRRGMKQTDAWNASTCDWTAAAIAHCHYISLKAFHEAIEYSAMTTPSNLNIVNSLCSLYASFGVIKYSGEFMMGGYMSTEQIGLVRKQLYKLLGVVRKECIPLVDAFDFPDGILNSVLGRYDGDVYTHLYEWALKAPRNKKQVHDVYHKYLKDLLKAKL